MSTNYFYHRSMLGLVSATILISLGATPVLAAQVSPTSTAIADSVKPAVTIKKVTQTISYTNPLTNQDVNITHVTTLQLDRNGNIIQAANDIWPEYFLPYFPGYTAVPQMIMAKKVDVNTTDSQPFIHYYPIDPTSSASPHSIHFVFRDINDKNVAYKTILVSARDSGHMLDLPQPPAGWKYVNQLPKQFHDFDNGTPINLMVEKITSPEIHQEKKQLHRQIILHLPGGNQVITQVVTAARTVKISNGKTITSEWQIPPFAKYQVPNIDGYTADITEVSPLQLTTDQLSDSLAPVEIRYQKDSVTTSEEGTQTTKPETKDEGTGTDSVTTSEEGTQTAKPETKDEGTGTDSVTTSEEGTQTTKPETKDEGTGTDSVTTREEGTQTTKPEMKDESTGTDSVTTSDEGTQTTKPEMKDEGIGTDSVTTREEGTQTAKPETKDEGTGTDSVTTREEGTQTTKPETKDEGTGTDSVTTSEEGTQTAKPETKDEGTGTDSVTTSEEGTQTTKPEMKDESTGTDSITTSEEGTQTTKPETKDEGTGTDSVTTSEEGTQTAKPETKDEGTGTDSVTTSEEGTQTAKPETKDEGTGTDSVTTSDEGTQATKPETKDEGTGTDSVTTSDEGTQTAKPETKDEGTGTDSVTTSEESTQTAKPETKNEGTGTDSVTTSEEGTQTAKPETKNEGTGTDSVTTSEEGTQTAKPETKDEGTGTDSVTTSEEGTQTAKPKTKDEGTGTDSVTTSEEESQADNSAKKHLSLNNQQDEILNMNDDVNKGALKNNGQDLQGDTNLSEMASNILAPRSNNLSSALTPINSPSTEHPIDSDNFHNQLAQLQAPLAELNDDQETSSDSGKQAIQLPQTGHHESLSTILLGLATGMIAAILPIKKWR